MARVPTGHFCGTSIRLGPAAPDGLIQRVGICGQSLGRGLDPRLSIGTLQLSIRCSSIHFLLRRSLPVRIAGELPEFGVGSPRRKLS